MSLPVRGARGRGRPRSPARASAARRSADRIAGTLVLAAVLAALVGLTTGDTFTLAADGLELHGAHYTAAADVRRALGLDRAAPVNLVTLHTAPLVTALRSLPAVDPARADAATVAVALPDRLVVTLQERVPILTWQVQGRRFLVDVTGTLFATLRPADGDPGLPVVHDDRLASVTLAVGAALDPSDLGAVRQLAALTPAFIGSHAASLALGVSDAEGFTIDAQPDLWHAVFGVYTATLRPPSIVPGQVQCLASLIAGREATLGVIRLAPTAARCGTYTPHASAAATATPAP